MRGRNGLITFSSSVSQGRAVFARKGAFQRAGSGSCFSSCSSSSQLAPFNKFAGRRSLFHWASNIVSSIAGDQPDTHVYNERKIFPFTREEVFDVVADVDNYHKFVPWCTHSAVLQRNGPNRMEAELGIGFKFLNQRYTSSIAMQRPSAIKVEVPESTLFHFLVNNWEFNEVEGNKAACEVRFHVSFSFRLRLHQAMADKYMDEVALRMVSVFQRRCADLYRLRTSKQHQPQQKQEQQSPHQPLS
ncbi:Coenzyme Q-binding protein coq10, mitochondrial [Balamuthia mandrillaris]